MLALYGTVKYSHGVSAANPSVVIRLRSPLSLSAEVTTDFALVRSKEELQRAAAAHLPRVMIVADAGLEKLSEAVLAIHSFLGGVLTPTRRFQ
jgi:hypothetical protein